MKWRLIKSPCAVQSLLTNLLFVKETARSLDCLGGLKTAEGCASVRLPTFYYLMSLRSKYSHQQSLRNTLNIPFFRMRDQ